MIEQHDNSVIYRDVFEDNVEDFTFMGVNNPKKYTTEITQPFHGFIVGDAVYYDIRTKNYKLALANNSIMSEVFGVISNIIDADTCEVVLKGNIKTNRYDYIPKGSILFLSPTISGRLIDAEPYKVSKIIGIRSKDGIEVNIQRGYDLHPEEVNNETPRFYTEQEIQDIINTIMKDIYY